MHQNVKTHTDEQITTNAERFNVETRKEKITGEREIPL